MVVFLNSSSKNLISTMHTFSRAKSDRKMDHWCHICARAGRFSLLSLHRVQRRLCYIEREELFSTLHSLSHRCNVARLSLLCGYFHSKGSDEIVYMVPLVLTFKAKTMPTTPRRTIPNYLRITRVRRKFHLEKFIRWTATFWNTITNRWFPDHYNPNHFKSRIDHYLSKMSV